MQISELVHHFSASREHECRHLVGAEVFDDGHGELLCRRLATQILGANLSSAQHSLHGVSHQVTEILQIDVSQQVSRRQQHGGRVGYVLANGLSVSVPSTLDDTLSSIIEPRKNYFLSHTGSNTTHLEL